jgi:hypothetical protein
VEGLEDRLCPSLVIVPLDFETPATGSGDSVKTSFGNIDLFGVHYSDTATIDIDLRNAGYGGTVLMNANNTDDIGTGRIEIAGGLGVSIDFHYGERFFPPDLFPYRGSITAYTYSRSLTAGPHSLVNLNDQLEEYLAPSVQSPQPDSNSVFKQFSLLDGAPITPPAPLAGP